jgi:transposase
VRERHVDALESWLTRARMSGIPEVVSFVAGLRRDQAAVAAALTLPFSNGQVEGQVNRLKFIKRSGYGRAKFDLLRQRVLAA